MLSSVASRWFLPGLLAVLLGAPLQAGSSNSLLDLSIDGELLACSNRDSGTVTIVRRESREKLHEIRVGKKPEGVSFVGNSHLLAVAVYGEDKVVLLDADAGKLRSELEVFDEPYGVVSDAAGTTLYVTLDYPGEVWKIDVASWKVTQRYPAGAFLRGLALSERDGRLYATEYYTGIVKAIDLKQQKVIDAWEGPSSDNLTRQLALHPSRPKAYVPHIRSRVRVAEGTGSIVPFISVLDTGAGTGKRRQGLPMDSMLNNFVVANPWELAVSPDGKRLVVVFSGTNDLYVCDVLDDNYQEVRPTRIITVGKNPRAVRFAPDGQSFYVYNALDFTVAVYELASLKMVGNIPVTANPLSPTVHRGKVLFYSALQPMVGRRWISCASCHPDGEADGRTWQNPEGLRNTTALFGMAWTHPIHWSADRDEVQDFEHTIRSPLMQGRGLVSGRPADALGNPLKGQSADLDGLAAYCNAHAVSLSPHARSGLSAAAKRGRELFFAQETGCATCHSGPFYTDSRPTKPFALHDVGTGGDDPSEKMGPKYDTPSLLGIYRTAPYLHHGKAKTLTDVLTTCNAQDKHGKTSHLNGAQIADLVEFLKALPYEDPEPAARAAGLLKIEH